MKRPWRTASVARPMSGVSSNGSARLSKPSGPTVRGRISNPIPLSQPMDDDEFPIRQPGTGIAAAPGGEQKEDIDETKPAQQTMKEEDEDFPSRPAATEAPPQEPEQNTVVLPNEATSEPRSTPVQQRPSEHRTTPSNALRQSMISSDTARTKSSKGQHEKKKSGLRGALGKLFGRKKKTDSVVVVSERSAAQSGQANQHQSVSAPVGSVT